MDDTFMTQVMDLEDLIYERHYLILAAHSGEVYQIYRNINKLCKVDQMTFEITTWCLNNPDSCTKDKFAESIKKNMFVLTGSFNDILQLLFGDSSERDWTDLEDAFYTYQTLGKNLGKVARTIMMFSKTNSIPPTVMPTA